MPSPNPSPSPILIEIIAEGSSFWESPFVGVIGTLLGVGIGAALTFWFGLVQDDRRAKRDLSNRYLDEIKTASTQIMRLSEDVSRHLFYWAQTASLEAHVLKRQSVQASLEVHLPAVKDLSDQIDNAYASITLIAPQAIRDAAHAVFWQIYLASALSTLDEAEKIKHAQRMIDKTRREFSRVVRGHFGVQESEAT